MSNYEMTNKEAAAILHEYLRNVSVMAARRGNGKSTMDTLLIMALIKALICLEHEED